MKRALSLFAIYSVAALSLLAQTSVRTEKSEHGMVVSSHSLASEAGIEIMKTGGNAIDAAVATGLALAVVHPAAGNIGGGGFMVIVTKDGKSTTIDFREKAPKFAHENMYLDANGKYIRKSNHEGYRSVGVPGTVAGFDLALKKYGTRDWKEVIQPAIRLADEGFRLSTALGNDFRGLKNDFKKYTSSAKVFLKSDTASYSEGELWRQPDLALSLKRIRDDGRNGFYKGKTAHLIADDMKRHGGLITKEDLAAYRAVERVPIRGTYRGYDVVSMPPPSSGGVGLIEMLNILEGYDLRSLGHNSPAYLHLLIEAMRNAYRDRARFLGDPDFVHAIPLGNLTSKKYAEEIRRSIDPHRASKSLLEQVAEDAESMETTHYSVMDGEGNAVVVTYTLEGWYGSRIVADGTGILLNNEMGDFNPIPGLTDSTGYIGTRPNLVEPEKRMLSSMTPTILLKGGKPWALIGSIGGRTIINTVLQAVLGLVDYNLPLADALEAGRIHHQWFPDEVLVERGFYTPELQKSLEAFGHHPTRSSKLGRMNCIVIDQRTGEREGVADSRDPDARAVGY
ncbi:MAG: gamma-glutamyltransferase [Ignavibacteria bacterium GWA2_54_16]|nr:MAG: gamma-glutamyltransferase [Ignavibacteria bacterium GWA2_54_16]